MARLEVETQVNTAGTQAFLTVKIDVVLHGGQHMSYFKVHHCIEIYTSD